MQNVKNTDKAVLLVQNAVLAIVKKISVTKIVVRMVFHVKNIKNVVQNIANILDVVAHVFLRKLFVRIIYNAVQENVVKNNVRQENSWLFATPSNAKNGVHTKNCVFLNAKTHNFAFGDNANKYSHLKSSPQESEKNVSDTRKALENINKLLG